MSWAVWTIFQLSTIVKQCITDMNIDEKIICTCLREIILIYIHIHTHVHASGGSLVVVRLESVRVRECLLPLRLTAGLLWCSLSVLSLVTAVSAMEHGLAGPFLGRDLHSSLRDVTPSWSLRGFVLSLSLSLSLSCSLSLMLSLSHAIYIVTYLCILSRFLDRMHWQNVSECQPAMTINKTHRFPLKRGISILMWCSEIAGPKPAAWGWRQ